MRARVILFLSVGLNVVLVAGWYLSSRGTSGKSVAPDGDVAVPDWGRVAKTNVVVRRQFFTWQELESPDYATYIANLRDIACPDQTIRDIIVADVNQLYSEKRAAEARTGEQQWWRSEADTNLTQAVVEKLRMLDEERRALLTRLLGPNWDNSVQVAVKKDSPRAGISLTGPVLGVLPPEVKQAVQDIYSRSQQRLADYVAAARAAGQEPDPAQIARLRNEARQELAAVLTPAQLEEYQLRYSQSAADMRAELRGFDISPEEFRNLFRAREQLDMQLALTSSRTDVQSARQRRTLEEQREKAMQQALGKDRYALMKAGKDPVFQQAQATARRYGSPPEAVLPLYLVAQAVDEERQRVRNDRTLTTEERIDRLQEVESDHERTLLGILGEASYERYLRDRASVPVPPLPTDTNAPRR